jgi:hypothetical protein
MDQLIFEIENIYVIFWFSDKHTIHALRTIGLKFET